MADVRLLAPVPRPGAIWCIGYNYRGHTAVEDPPYPDVFVKTANTVVGPDEPVLLPRASADVDYEAELAVVIGTTAHDVTPDRALEHVAGYTVFDDVSARDWQRRTSQWVLGKSFDTFGPMGPALVTVDEVPDPQDLAVELRCNGELTVSSHTSRMVFPVAFLVSYLSQVATLQPGDVIATGTPQKLPDALGAPAAAARRRRGRDHDRPPRHADPHVPRRARRDDDLRERRRRALMTLTRLWSTHPDDLSHVDGATLRERFVLSGLFTSGEVSWGYAHDDRLLVGGVVLDGRPVTLTAPDEIAAEHLLDRRELAIVGLAGAVQVAADDESFAVGHHDVLYLPMGTRSITLSGEGVVYLVSAPAHRRTAAALASRDEVVAVRLGAPERSNDRTIRKYVHADGIESNQLVLGITTLEPGSVWNTMPPHVHARRTEVYLYDGLGDDVLVHLMGRPDETRHLLLHDRDVVVSPPWSVHTASATGRVLVRLGDGRREHRLRRRRRRRPARPALSSSTN